MSSRFHTKEVSTFNYYVPGIENRLHSADQAISYWLENGRNLSRQVSKDPTQIFDGNLPSSNTCTCKADGVTSKEGVCVGCSVVSTFYDRGFIKIGQPLIIGVGKYTGLMMTPSNTCQNSTFSGYKKSIHNQEFCEHIINKYVHMNSCEKKFVHNTINTDFYECQGGFSQHYMAVSSVIRYEMEKVNIPCNPRFLWGWFCTNNLYSVDINYDIGDVSKISSYFMDEPTTIKGILGQLVSTLHFLTNYTFTHGEGTAEFLHFDNKVASYEYKGVIIESPITLHLIPGSSSSISILTEKGINRVYHPGVKYLNSLSIIDEPTIEVTKGKEQCTIGGDVTYFKIGDNYPYYSNMVRNHGVPLFSSSYDLYSFLTSLMCDSSFYTSFNNIPQYTDIWKSLFLNDDYIKLEQFITEFHRSNTNPNRTQLLRLLSGMTLRCDAINYFWERFTS